MAELKEETLGTPRQFIIYLAINIAIGFGLYSFLQDIRQTIAATIFIALVIGSLMFWRLKVAIAFIGVAVLLLTRTIDLSTTISFMNLDVIIFLVGMMVVVAFLRRSGFFRWLLAKALGISKFEPKRLMIIILVVASMMAAMVDEVTSILFIVPLVLELCDYFEVNPVNYIISVVLATNVGSSLTVLGNPIGILIALRSGLTFENFLQWALPVGVISLVSLIIIILIWQRSALRLLKTKMEAKWKEGGVGFLGEWGRVKGKGVFTGSAAIFLGVIVSLALHHRMELALGLEPNTLLVAISILGAGVAMLWQRGLAREVLTRHVDWWTLIFFMFLFAKAGALEFVGLTGVMTDYLFNLSGGNTVVLIPLVLWISGFASAVADNVVVVATFVPVVQSLTAKLGNPVLWWALLFGGCYGGNMTMVGSTANIVAVGILEDRKSYYMKFRHWIKIGVLGSLVPMAIATAALLIFS